MKFNSKNGGFTIIEMVIVIMLTAILAAVSIPQFIDYRVEAKNSKTQSYLGSFRTGIANQYAQQILRCGAAAGQWPYADSVQANDITAGATPRCTTTQVPSAAERKFVADATIPLNPWGTVPAGSVTACSAAGCTRCNGAGCNNVAASGGWCFNETTGDFWADSANNTGLVGFKECNF